MGGGGPAGPEEPAGCHVRELLREKEGWKTARGRGRSAGSLRVGIGVGALLQRPLSSWKAAPDGDVLREPPAHSSAAGAERGAAPGDAAPAGRCAAGSSSAPVRGRRWGSAHTSVRPLRTLGWQSGMPRPPPQPAAPRGSDGPGGGCAVTTSIRLLCRLGPAVLQDGLLRLTLPGVSLSHPRRDASLWLCIFISTYVRCSCVDGSWSTNRLSRG